MRFLKTPPARPRRAGALLHVTSLPSPGGVGTLGAAAFQFVDFLAESGLRLWQMLPVGPAGLGESPYQSASAFAGDPLLIDLDDLVQRNLLDASNLSTIAPASTPPDRAALRAEKETALRASWRASREKCAVQREAFSQLHPWLDDWALFRSLQDRFDGVAWQDWPDHAAARREPAALDAWRAELADEIDYHRYVQFLFGMQWAALRRYAAGRGVRLFGDMPIYASADSADCWAHPELFQLDAKGRPTRVAGVPPDYFCQDGQRWGNPLYNWKTLKKQRYGWWVERMRQNAERFDLVRIDHFIGFANYYSIPASAPTAREGEWVKGPGRPLFRAIEKAVPDLAIVAEDLGEISPRVKRLLKACGYPGMRVLQFGFDGNNNPHAPENHIPHCVAYTGTHDNDTLRGFLASADAETLAALHTRFPAQNDLAAALLEALFQSPAETVIVPLQDFLRLGSEARMNTPGTVSSQNWRWRLPSSAPLAPLAPKIRALCKATNRLTDKE